MNVLFLEPFFGGSHRAFAEGLQKHSKHTIDLVTLPDRFWKWRMRGASLHFARKIRDPGRFDVLICSDMLSLLDLKGLWGESIPPSILYFHENQLSYPVPEGEKLDYHFAFTNLTSAIAADRVVFNSEFHRNAYFRDVGRFIRRLPEYRPGWAIDEIRDKASVIYPGCETAPIREARDSPPLIIWNHRWEFDKQPQRFFDALTELVRRGLDFRVALLGENFQSVPKPFLEAKQTLGDRIIQFGYLESYDEYRAVLERGTVVVSTAIQENFGISIVEAINAGCRPVLPKRLSYPELVPSVCHESVFYEHDEQLPDAIGDALTRDNDACDRTLITHSERYSWNTLAPVYDSFMEELA